MFRFRYYHVDKRRSFPTSLNVADTVYPAALEEGWWHLLNLPPDAPFLNQTRWVWERGRHISPRAQPDWWEDYFLVEWTSKSNEHDGTNTPDCTFTDRRPFGNTIGLTAIVDRQELSRFLLTGVNKRTFPAFEHRFEHLS